MCVHRGFSSVLLAPGKAPGIVMEAAEPEAAPAPKAAALTYVKGGDIQPKPDAQIKGGSVLSQIAAEGLNRLNNDDANPNLMMDSWATSTEPKNQADMMALAIKQNPTVKFWDPLNIISEDVKPETIGWFRHAEIKHGRVAMAAFVGYCFQSNGIVFPWNIQAPIDSPFDAGTSTLPVLSFADIAAAGSPADQWDALPTAAKWQIICVVGFLEVRRPRSPRLLSAAYRTHPTLTVAIGFCMPDLRSLLSRLRTDVERDVGCARDGRPEALCARRQAGLLPPV